MIFALSILITFTTVFLRAFQQKNVAGGHYKAMAATGFLIAAVEVSGVLVVSTAGWWAMLTAGLGGAIGVVLAVLLHDRIMPPKCVGK